MSDNELIVTGSVGRGCRQAIYNATLGTHYYNVIVYSHDLVLTETMRLVCHDLERGFTTFSPVINYVFSPNERVWLINDSSDLQAYSYYRKLLLRYSQPFETIVI